MLGVSLLVSIVTVFPHLSCTPMFMTGTVVICDPFPLTGQVVAVEQDPLSLATSPAGAFPQGLHWLFTALQREQY